MAVKAKLTPALTSLRRSRNRRNQGSTLGFPVKQCPTGFDRLWSAVATVAEFERGLAAIPEVRHAERLFGDPDYLVRVAIADLEAYQALRDERLATLPGVRRLTSTIVMKRVVDERPFLAQPDDINREQG